METVKQVRERQEEEARIWDELTDKYPAWQVYEEFGGFMAVPTGTDVIHASTIESMAVKLAAQPEPEVKQ